MMISFRAQLILLTFLLAQPSCIVSKGPRKSNDAGLDTGDGFIGCTANSGCLDAGASVCEFDAGLCTGCMVDADCSHIDGKNVCDNGECVECTPQNETPCDGNSCNPQTLSCTSTKLGDLDVCEACVSDTECKDNHKCIALDYDGAAHGSYCMKLLSAGCNNPYRVILSKKSVLAGEDDATEDFCGINESMATCEAVLAFDMPCTEDGRCEINAADTEVPAALCRTVNGSATTRCSYRCDDNLQCSSSADCKNSGDGVTYCGGL